MFLSEETTADEARTMCGTIDPLGTARGCPSRALRLDGGGFPLPLAEPVGVLQWKHAVQPALPARQAFRRRGDPYRDQPLTGIGISHA